MRKFLYICLAILILIFLIFFLQNKKEIPNADIRHGVYLQKETTSVKIGGQTINAEVVDTPELRTLGLSGRAEIKEDTGMLFVFDEPGEYLFWMKDMNFAIDIIWINEEGSVIYIQKNARPESYPESFGPKEKTSKFVLEVFSGFSDKHSLKVGDAVEFISNN